jgi:hypothetical protein
MRSGSQGFPRDPSKVPRLQGHLEDYDPVLIKNRNVKPNEGVQLLVTRQFPGHGHSVPSRGLHVSQFFSDLIISEAEVAIGQGKIIARHGLSQRQPPDLVPKSAMWPTKVPSAGATLLTNRIGMSLLRCNEVGYGSCVDGA